MPEGHIIHRLARELMATLGDAPVRATSPQGRFSNGATLIDGERLTGTDAYGKFLFVRFESGPVLHVHLGLIGKLTRLTDGGTEPRDTTRLRLANDTTCWDLTGPQTCRIITPDEQRVIVSHIGADPLRRHADVAAARSKLARTARPIGATLLDQHIISGLGNIYRAEILFLCGINPMRPSSSIADAEFDQIWSESVRLLRIGRRTGRILCTDPDEIGRPRSRMTREDAVYVYHREHCRRCGRALVTLQLAGRPMQYCPTCQPI